MIIIAYVALIAYTWKKQKPATAMASLQSHADRYDAELVKVLIVVLGIQWCMFVFISRADKGGEDEEVQATKKQGARGNQ